MPATPEIREKLKHLSSRPGVYLMKGESGEILYVGKAKVLKNRVRSYFSGNHAGSLKTQELVRRIRDFETIVVGSEAEALILENNLIKEHKPRFNVSLKDDKGYPYIKLTVEEAFPRIEVTRDLVRDGSRYFGPYTDVRRMRSLVDLIRRLYTVRNCSYDLPRNAPPRPCLDYHIGRCLAPCVGLQSKEEYAEMVEEILGLLSGSTKRTVQRINEEMKLAVENLQFERAGELRDSLHLLETLEEKQNVVDVSGADRDIVAFARDREEACGVVLRVRGGKLLGREATSLYNIEEASDAEIIASFATRFYTTRPLGERGEEVPPEILFSCEFDDRETLEGILRERTGRWIRTSVPQRGDKARLIDLATTNARHLLEEQHLLEKATQERAPDELYELQDALSLPQVPRTMVCFDISHTQGTETVASVVFFENAKPAKGEYRKMKIQGDWGNDDFRSMHEAVTRYFRRRIEENLPLPDLTLIDGGKGQLHAAEKALKDLGLDTLPLASLAKREEEIFLRGQPHPLRLPRRSAALRLLQQARDEAHRFAITYNRKLRSKRTISSNVSQIPGIGPKRQRQLLGRFGSLRALAQADVEEVAALPGFGRALAESVLNQVRSMPGILPNPEIRKEE